MGMEIALKRSTFFCILNAAEHLKMEGKWLVCVCVCFFKKTRNASITVAKLKSSRSLALSLHLKATSG